MTTAVSRYEHAARMLAPRPRRYRTPGHLATRVEPGTRSSPALDLIDQALVELMAPDSPHDALAIYMPAQEGKSQRVSRRFPEWILDHDPSVPVAIVSYEKDLALRWGRDIKQDVEMHPCPNGGADKCGTDCGGLHIQIRRDSSAAGRWDTPQGGGIYCVGVGGALTGRPAGVLVIDDPVKDRAAAESEKIQENTWKWWEGVALLRTASPPKVVMIMTRWHMEDLGGRIESRPGPLHWRKLVIPAIAVNDDPLGRKPGEEMPSVRDRPPGYFKLRQQTMSNYVFSSAFQQTPTPAEGNFYRRATFRYWRPMPGWPDGRERLDLEGQPVTLVDTWRFITMDFAASTKTSADYTVASAWAITQMGDLILLDRKRKRVPDHEHFAMAAPLRMRWGIDMVFAEANWWSQTFVTDAIAAGWPVLPLTADKDKLTRAIPSAARVHAGRVWFPAVTSGCECGNCPEGGVWLDEWLDELAAFNSGTHDDQVDTLAYAALVQVGKWTPPREEPRPGVSEHERAVNAATAAATGHAELDIWNVPL